MKERIEKILNDGDTEERLRKVLSLSDLLVSATIAEDLPKNESLNYVALELYNNAEALLGIYNDILTVTMGEKQAIV